MIKITGFGYQGDNVEATILFDLSGQDYTRNVSTTITQLLGMTDIQIRNWVINFVAGQRRALQETAVESLLTPLIDVDLES